MGALIQWGDVPAWVGAGTGIAALLRGLGNRQQVQFQGWVEILGELTDLEPEDLRRTVQDHPVIAEIVAIATEEAARTASDDKRYLLAPGRRRGPTRRRQPGPGRRPAIPDPNRGDA